MLSRKELDDIAIRLKQRDGHALHELYVDMFPPLQRYAFRFVYDWEEAKDIVQSAFLQLWSNTSGINAGMKLESYIVSIVHNLCSNHLRHLNIVDSHQDKIIEATLFMNINNDAEIDPEVKKKLEEALRNLPEKTYEILMDHIVGGKKNSEIALEYGIAESTVKTHLKRAMRVLREQMLSIIFF